MHGIPRLLVYSPFVALADLAILHGGFFLVFFLEGRLGTPASTAYIHNIPSICAFALAILQRCNLYTGWLDRGGQMLVYCLALGTALIVLATMALTFWERQPQMPLTLAGVIALAQFALLTNYRLLLRKLYRLTVSHIRIMVIAPDEDQAIALVRKLEPGASRWMRFAGWLAPEDVADEDLAVRHITERDLAEREDRGRHPATGALWDVALLAPGLGGRREVIDRCARMGKEVIVVPEAMEMALLSARPMEVGDSLLFRLRPALLTPGQVLIKSCFDLAISAVLLLVLSPVFLLAWALIRTTSRGPAIFRQDRVGREGREFTLYKFRTMVADAERQTGPVLAQRADPRITALGRILRASRIDELPQLFNVLRGEMSLIGPRPERGFFVRTFLETVPGYGLRLRVKPGITGLAQVAGGYSTPVERKLRFDLLYIHDYSLSLDVWILLRTVLVVLLKERAEGLKASPVPSVIEEP